MVLFNVDYRGFTISRQGGPCRGAVGLSPGRLRSLGHRPLDVAEFYLGSLGVHAHDDACSSDSAGGSAAGGSVAHTSAAHRGATMGWIRCVESLRGAFHFQRLWIAWASTRSSSARAGFAARTNLARNAARLGLRVARRFRLAGYAMHWVVRSMIVSASGDDTARGRRTVFRGLRMWSRPAGVSRIALVAPIMAVAAFEPGCCVAGALTLAPAND